MAAPVAFSSRAMKGLRLMRLQAKRYNYVGDALKVSLWPRPLLKTMAHDWGFIAPQLFVSRMTLACGNSWQIQSGHLNPTWPADPRDQRYSKLQLKVHNVDRDIMIDKMCFFFREKQTQWPNVHFQYWWHSPLCKYNFWDRQCYGSHTGLFLFAMSLKCLWSFQDVCVHKSYSLKDLLTSSQNWC